MNTNVTDVPIVMCCACVMLVVSETLVWDRVMVGVRSGLGLSLGLRTG